MSTPVLSASLTGLLFVVVSDCFHLKSKFCCSTLTVLAVYVMSADIQPALRAGLLVAAAAMPSFPSTSFDDENVDDAAFQGDLDLIVSEEQQAASQLSATNLASARSRAPPPPNVSDQAREVQSYHLQPMLLVHYEPVASHFFQMHLQQHHRKLRSRPLRSEVSRNDSARKSHWTTALMNALKEC